MKPTVLVTGGAGYVGSHVCKALWAAGAIPVTYDNLSHGHRRAVNWGPFERGDVADVVRLDAVFKTYRPSAVMHFAAVTSVQESMIDPGKYFANNVANMLVLLDVLRRNEVDRLILSSTAAVYGIPSRLPIDEAHPQNPLSPYGTTKQMCERILRDYADAYGIRSVSLRYFNAAGADPDGEIGEAHDPETHLIPLVLDAALGRRRWVSVFGRTYSTRDGTCERDYVHVSDLASAHVLALRYVQARPGAHAFNLGNGRGATVLEVIRAARRVTRKAIRVRIAEARPGDPPALCADPSRAMAEIGWRPVYADLEVQVRHAWQWHASLHEGRRFALAADEDLGRSAAE
jgi:UDP-arabinose 4-epimerase